MTKSTKKWFPTHHNKIGDTNWGLFISLLVLSTNFKQSAAKQSFYSYILTPNISERLQFVSKFQSRDLSVNC